jgi:hypothetical protein
MTRGAPMVRPVYTLESGHVIARDGVPLLTLGRARSDSGHYEMVATEADALARRIVALLNDDIRAERC